MKKLIILVLIVVAFISCEKEYSIEGTGGASSSATGTLLDSLGNCKAIQVIGIYKEATVLTASNYITASVNFTTSGNYKIYSDTVNGFYFYTEGFAFLPGPKNISIQGFGTPFIPIDTDFKLFFKNSTCRFKVNYNGSIVVQNANNDYFPTSTLSNWTYNNSSISDTVIISVLSQNKTILGNVYRQFALQVPKLNAFDTLFYRKDGTGNYYRYNVIGSGTMTEFTFLKDYIPVATSWESPVVVGTLSGNPTNVKYKFTIMEKDVTSTIGGKIFDSIISVKEETQYFDLGAYSTKNVFIYRYAKKIGLVDVTQQNAIPNITIPIKRWQVY